MFDPMDTKENWAAVTHSDAKMGDYLAVGSRTYRITGFGPYFVWVVNTSTQRETKLAGKVLCNVTQQGLES